MATEISLDTGPVASSSGRYQSFGSQDPLERGFLLERSTSAPPTMEVSTEVVLDPEWSWNSCCALGWPLVVVCTVALVVVSWTLATSHSVLSTSSEGSRLLRAQVQTHVVGGPPDVSP